MTREEAIERFAKVSDSAINSPDSCDVISLYESIEIIKEIYNDFESRSCDNCKHWNNDCRNISINTTGFCIYFGISNGDFEDDMKNNFYCNKWEQK